MSKVTARFFDRHTTLAQIQELVPGRPVIGQKQIHSTKVTVIKNLQDLAKIKSKAPQADAIVTSLPEVGLVVHTADCLPLLAYDEKVIGVCHAGWRGLADGIVTNWISALTELGAKLENLKIEAGPAIGSCHFEVGSDVADKLSNVNGYHLGARDMATIRLAHPHPVKAFIDLKELVQYHLRVNGIKKENVKISEECTFCNKEKYFSYRRDGPKAGRQESFIYRSK